MKHKLLLTAALIIFLCGCNHKKTNRIQEKSTEADTTLCVPCRLLTDTLLPRSIDLNQNIDHLTFQELRLLRSYPYAIHGYHFMEADINAFFSANTNWYTDLVYDLYENYDMVENGHFPENYEEVDLTAEEREFVKRIDARIEQLRQQQESRPGVLPLKSTDYIVNLFQFEDIQPELLSTLQKYNFAITRGTNLQLFHAYEENDYRQIPNFITTDLYLQAFHMYFSYVLKSLEKQRFIPTIEKLCASMNTACMNLAEQTNDEKIRELAEYTATFYAIPYYLLTGETAMIPSRYATEFQEEIERINTQEDNFSKYLAFEEAYFPYSLFKPRGHYTRDPRLSTYFKAMMWLQVACFCRDNREQLERAIFQASLLCGDSNTDQGSHKKLYRHVYDPLTFLMGEPDNLSILDISQMLENENSYSPEKALRPDMVEKIDGKLCELAKSRNRIRNKIEISCSDKINFMPQRYLADNEVLQELVDITPNSQRAYPKGLDVFAAQGVSSAETLLTDFYRENENWDRYSDELQKLKEKFSTRTSVPTTVYDLWMDGLITLQQTGTSLPTFMLTPEWGYKNLNTALASWAELKHDAILYGEQPLAAECGGGGPPDPIVVGYVEPNLPFWKKLLEIVLATETMLQQNNGLTNDLKGKTDRLKDYVSFLIIASEKELKGKTLSDVEYRSIENMGSSIEYFTLSVLDPDVELYEWSLVQGPDKSIAVVADVYTRNITGCNKNGILHVASGNANNIYVMVEIGGNVYLTRGATFSYYEFIQPLNTRMTDEEWQQMLEHGTPPEAPKWMKNILLEKEPRVNERIFYSSGC